MAKPTQHLDELALNLSDDFGRAVLGIDFQQGAACYPLIRQDHRGLHFRVKLDFNPSPRGARNVRI